MPIESYTMAGKIDCLPMESKTWEDMISGQSLFIYKRYVTLEYSKS
jgi:hypothetical protein